MPHNRLDVPNTWFAVSMIFIPTEGVSFFQCSAAAENHSEGHLDFRCLSLPPPQVPAACHCSGRFMQSKVEEWLTPR